jgi:hypothetical protein
MRRQAGAMADRKKFDLSSRRGEVGITGSRRLYAAAVGKL